ncbi:hypothetical protein I302_105430 [Kwoniella bestiolae CBS 10118]|uniref:Uncharacterized protein n=1 Tax=Kwoniella bestiolae CBS 10118 TaxID=1296100 RepID=A0A1B9FT42_9TREE|nr:hypothetical protein I302_08711 [Kwoniella bestiolae CBS 10118]OCF21932.1 hypothetical protein I302_08711 [Kwoniella bestiolae CBS 10118]
MAHQKSYTPHGSTDARSYRPHSTPGEASVGSLALSESGSYAVFALNDGPERYLMIKTGPEQLEMTRDGGTDSPPIPAMIRHLIEFSGIEGLRHGCEFRFADDTKGEPIREAVYIAGRPYDQTEASALRNKWFADTVKRSSEGDLSK